jgi:hypothetical protein
LEYKLKSRIQIDELVIGEKRAQQVAHLHVHFALWKAARAI